MSKLIEINANKSSNDLVVQRLREALEMAESGNLQSCAIICTTYDNQVLDCWANGGDVYRLLGAIEGMKLDFMLSQIEER